jgi:cytochrome c oxidase subunit 2
MQGVSSYSGIVDGAFWYILGISAVLLVGITIVMIWFAFRYSVKRNPNPAQIHGSVALETLWTVIPTLLVLSMFWYGWTGFKRMRDVPQEAMLVKVTARMWSWSFEYPDGRRSQELVVPVGRPVRLELHSKDVLHSFFVPAFRLKEDAVPGRTNHAWFQADKAGSYDLLCAEYCGDQHSKMLGTVRVLPDADYATWQANPPAMVTGPELLAAKGCTTCHSQDGSRMVGPSFKGLMGRKEVVVETDGESEVTVDEAYLRRSILEPKAQVVKGFDPVMPEQRDLLSNEELDEIIKVLQGL